MTLMPDRELGHVAGDTYWDQEMQDEAADTECSQEQAGPSHQSPTECPGSARRDRQPGSSTAGGLARWPCVQCMHLCLMMLVLH